MNKDDENNKNAATFRRLFLVVTDRVLLSLHVSGAGILLWARG
jgi:hypothetical protein